jgi:Secretion system C-terminal sorting domain
MKRIIVFIGLCLATAQGFAQGYTVAHDTTYASVNGTADVHNSITNSSNLSSLNITWLGTLYPSTGWSVTGICDIVNGSQNGNCYNWPIGQTQLTIPAGLSADFKVSFKNDDVTPAPVGSVCYFSILISTTGSANKTIWYKVTKDPLGVNTFSRVNDAIVIFPNPARDVVNVSIDPSLGAKTILISNLIGRTIGSYNVSAGVQKIDMDNAPTGMYFLRVFDNQGKLLETKKFTHL